MLLLLLLLLLLLGFRISLPKGPRLLAFDHRSPQSSRSNTQSSIYRRWWWCFVAGWRFGSESLKPPILRSWENIWTFWIVIPTRPSRPPHLGQWHTEQVDDHLPWIQFVAAPVVLSVLVIVLSISLPDIIAEMDTQRRWWPGWWWLWARRRRIWKWGWNKLYSEIVHHFISISVHAHFQWSPNFCGFINVVSFGPCCSLNWATAAHPIDDVAVPCCGYVKWVSWRGMMRVIGKRCSRPMECSR